jgi:response regulator of citrate/malate metabolism
MEPLADFKSDYRATLRILKESDVFLLDNYFPFENGLQILILLSRNPTPNQIQ